MRNEERKHKEVPTSKLLDFVGKKYEYTDEKNLELKREYENELENREPYDHLKSKIDRQQKQINEMREKISELLDHRHDTHNGNVTIPIKESRNYF